MKRPLLKVAVLYVAGVVLANFCPLPLAALLVCSFVVGGICLIATRARPILLGLLLALAGATNLNLHTAIVSPHDLRLLIADREEQVVLRGVLRQTPSPKIYQHGQEAAWRTVAELEVNALQLNTEAQGWQPASGRVTISTPGILALVFFRGQKVEVAGKLRVPKGALAEGLFDYRTHLRRLGIYYQLSTVSTNAWKLNETDNGTTPPLGDRFVAWGRNALARGLPVEDESLRLEWALTLGWKTALTEEVSEPFVRAATYHIFAVDGLRIAILSGIFLGLFRVLGLSRAVSGMMVIPLIWFYAGMTGFPASAIRATVMATVVIGGWALKRPSDVMNSLFAAALIILVWEPSQLFQAGFQLSFVVVLCIILLMPVFEGYAEHFFRFDPWLPFELRPFWQRILSDGPIPHGAPAARPQLRPFWQRSLRSTGRFFWDTFLVSLVAWLGSIPLVALYFHIFTPVSAPANLFAVPLCALVLVCNLSSLLLAGWFPWAAEFYNHAGWFLMECIRQTSHWSAHWPAAYFYVPAPSGWTMGLYYLLLLTVATGWVFRIRHRSWAIAGLTILTSGWCLQQALDRQTTDLTILPLKGAAAIFIDAPGRANDVLIDCGDENSASSVLKPFLQAQGINQLHRLLLTQGDLYHAAGVEVLRQALALSQINVSPVRFRSSAYRRILMKLESAPGLVKTIQRGDHCGSWEVLHPDRDDHFSQADDNAVVWRVEFDGTRILLLSDLGRLGQNALFARERDLRADIVVASLPKHGEPLAEPLLDAIQPRLIILADVEYPASARANRKLRERLERRGVPVACVAQAGAVTLSFHRNGWRMKTMNPLPKGSLAPAEPDPIEDESQ